MSNKAANNSRRSGEKLVSWGGKHQFRKIATNIQRRRQDAITARAGLAECDDEGLTSVVSDVTVGS